ncbi:MAG: acyl-CoA dehydrogenase family protein [SAR324 cluster bacterium]|nr:acyl-CoA dehydrogenase family protein [SAR324 cluster bacterium]
MDFTLTDEQQMLVEMTHDFVENEMLPHEETLERTDALPPELAASLKKRAIELGLHACNLPENVGGGGLDAVSVMLIEKELGRTSLALAECAHRPLNILASCEGEQVTKFLEPTVLGEKRDCIAMTEPGSGSDLRGMKCKAVLDGDEWIINGEKHFISQASVSDYCVLFAATGEEKTDRVLKKRISAFLVDFSDPGVEVAPGYKNVSHRGYTNNILRFENARIPKWRIMGPEGDGFRLINQWLGPTRLTVAATCVSRAERAFEIALNYSVIREQFGQKISKFQGISFPLADMATEIKMANLMLLETAWKIDQRNVTPEDCAMTKLFCTEMLSRIADQALQTVGGMGLMEDLPLERIWRDARVERIWDGTSEIQRHIISRGLLRPLENES